MLFNVSMPTNPEIHRENLQLLVDEFKGVGKLAETLGKSDSQVSQWLNASLNSGTGKPRGMRPDTARFIEEKCKKKRGWMDVQHSAAPTQPSDLNSQNQHGFEEDRRRSEIDRRASTEMEVVIPQYNNTGGGMGGGVLLRDQPGEIQGWRVTPEWLQKNVPNNTGVKNLCIVTGFGPSMRPLFNPGDPLLMDRGVTKAEEDAVYFFRVGDEGFIKHLQRVPGVGLVAISENKIYRDWTITNDMDFEVFGKVIKVWQGNEV